MKRGLTSVETLILITIVVLITAIAIPTFLRKAQSDKQTVSRAKEAESSDERFTVTSYRQNIGVVYVISDNKSGAVLIGYHTGSSSIPLTRVR